MSTANFNVREHVIPGQHIRQYPQASTNIDADELQISIKQYSPKDNPNPQPGDITLIGAHANGVIKELYEPLWDALYEHSKKTGAFKIRSIWIADVAHQGASSVINEDQLGIDPSWWDHPRDILHMTNVFRKEMVPPLIGIGHSMGGCQMANVAFMHPRLLAGIVLMEPVIQKGNTLRGNYLPAYMSTFRRDVWPNREFAAQQLWNNPFYQAWDPRCVNLLIEHGFRDLPTAIHPEYKPKPPKPGKKPEPAPSKPVTLTTPKHQEVFSFMRPNFPAENTEEALATHQPPRRTHPDLSSHPGPRQTPFYRPEPLATLDNITHLRPRCLYIFGELSPLSDPESCKQKMEYTGIGDGGNGGKDVDNAVIGIRMKNGGHFVPFEQPAKVADEVGSWLGKEMVRWRAEREADEKEWDAIKKQRGGLGRLTMSDEYLAWMRALGEMVRGDGASSSSKSKI